MVILVTGGQESADRRFGDSSSSVASSTGDRDGPGSIGSAGGHGDLAADGQPTYRPKVVSRVPRVPEVAPDAAWPNLGFSSVPIGMDLGWGPADGKPEYSAGASGAGRSSLTVPGLPIALVGAAALFGVGRAVMRRRPAQPRVAEAADVTLLPGTDSATVEAGPLDGADAAAPESAAAPATVVPTGAAGAAAAAPAPPSVDSAGPASKFPPNSRSAAAPAPTRRPAGGVTVGRGTALLSGEASSRVQLYVKPDWGPR